MNLLGNAIKFTSAPGEVRLAVSYVEESGLLQFEVEDTGIGIAADKLDTLFQPFVQADGSITRDFGGSGLGLAISVRLAEMLGGGIAVRSQVGVGSVFTLSIDPGDLDGVTFAEMTLSQQMESHEEEAEVSLEGRFLVVDDRPDIRMLAQHFVEEAGGKVELASHGQEAIDAVERSRQAGSSFDVILMDMQMPVLDGYSAARELRRKKVHTPIVALTANAMRGEQEKCIEAGCTAFVSKPIDRVELLRVISDVQKAGS